jgi:hypothetical protein
MQRNRLSAVLACTCILAGLVVPASAADRASGERSWSKAQEVPRWRLARYPASQVARLDYREIGLDRLLHLQRSNAARRIKPTQVGLARRATIEATRPGLPPLKWIGVGRGAAVARIEVRSRDALALRVGLQFDRMDDRVELRFAGSDDPSRVVAAMHGAEARKLLGAQRLFWTPSTDGEVQVIEIYRPAGVAAVSVRVQAPQVSHLVANSRNDFKIIEKIGESGGCNVDTSCRVAQLGPRFVDAKNAVAHMQFVQAGSTYLCTGTLLADTTSATQVPYFYGANHCFADGEGPPVASQMQAVANTLNTFWNYEATACGSGISTQRTQLSGGAAYLYSGHDTDGMLLRLNNAPPASAYFAGWTAAPLPASSAILGIHHPSGDAKKVSAGQHVTGDAFLHEVGWLDGTTEGGSSGSGLFTLGNEGYALRGGLYGGEASCANTGSLSNRGNFDLYSRFDVVFPHIRGFLASEAIPMNGSQPLVPPRPSPTAAASAPAAVQRAVIPENSGTPDAERAGRKPVSATDWREPRSPKQRTR